MVRTDRNGPRAHYARIDRMFALPGGSRWLGIRFQDLGALEKRSRSTAAATDTFRESTPFAIGMRVRRSQIAVIECEIPSNSLPMTRPTRDRDSIS